MNAALLALPVASRVTAGMADPQVPRLAGTVFLDDRVRDCAVFADYAGKAGAAIRCVGDDITAPEYEALKTALARKSGVIAGLTPEPMAFLFEVMARDVRRHQVFRGDHYYSGGKLFGHRFKAPLHLLKENFPLPGIHGYWTGDLVDIMSRYDPAAISPATSTIWLSGDHVPQHDFKLVSWVIAPLSGE
ncbi:MAG: hypothetical protein OXQ29_28170 [Rhodospirillaceae bacterium]|nr:hypothetical protein [Rhodospirillaceae bacterium]